MEALPSVRHFEVHGAPDVKPRKLSRSNMAVTVRQAVTTGTDAEWAQLRTVTIGPRPDRIDRETLATIRFVCRVRQINVIA